VQAENFEPGSFLIIRCTEGEEEYTAAFHSRVSFNGQCPGIGFSA
jgi:hypothetical protein